MIEIETVTEKATVVVREDGAVAVETETGIFAAQPPLLHDLAAVADPRIQGMARR